MNIDEVTETCFTGQSIEITDIMETISANPDFLLARSREFGTSILDLAVLFGNEELVSALLKAGADPNSFKPPNEIPLILAIESENSNKTNILRLLIKHGANVNASGVLTASAMHAAVAKSSPEIVELLLENEADINIHYPPDDFTPLWFACLGEEDKKMVQLLLSRGADYELRDATACTSPLDVAIGEGNVSVASLLLEAGANPNSRGLGREAPLINVMLNPPPNTLAIAKLLLQHGADINATGEHVASPLHAAVLTAPVKLVELLLQHGADVSKPSSLDGLTVMEIAVTRGDMEIIEALVKYY